MEVIDMAQALGLSEEETRRLRDRLQSTLVEIVRSPRVGIMALAKPKPTASVKFNPKEITVAVPKFKK